MRHSTLMFGVAWLCADTYAWAHPTHEPRKAIDPSATPSLPAPVLDAAPDLPDGPPDDDLAPPSVGAPPARRRAPADPDTPRPNQTKRAQDDAGPAPTTAPRGGQRRSSTRAAPPTAAPGPGPKEPGWFALFLRRLFPWSAPKDER